MYVSFIPIQALVPKEMALDRLKQLKWFWIICSTSRQRYAYCIDANHLQPHFNMVFKKNYVIFAVFWFTYTRNRRDLGQFVSVLAKQFESDPKIFGDNIGNGSKWITSICKLLYILEMMSKCVNWPIKWATNKF